MKYLYIVLGAGCFQLEDFNLNESNYYDLLPEYERMRKVVFEELIGKEGMEDDELKERSIEIGIGTRAQIMSANIYILKAEINNIILNPTRLLMLVKTIIPSPNKNQTRFFEKFNNFSEIMVMFLELTRNSQIAIKNIRIKCYNYSISNNVIITQ